MKPERTPDQQRRHDYYMANRAKILARSKAWAKANVAEYRERGTAWSRANPDKRLASSLKTRYGMSVERYNDMLSSQGGACAICREPPAGKRLYVDHCHTSGSVCGLLCHRCNTGIGMMRESSENLRRAAEYVKERKEHHGDV